MKPAFCAAVLLAAALLLASACSAPAVATAGDLLAGLLGETPAPGGMHFVIQYMDESVASQYVETRIEGSGEAFGTLYGLLASAVEQPADTMGALSPEASCSHRILMGGTPDGRTIVFFYIRSGNLAVYRNPASPAPGALYEYRFFTPSADLAAFLDSQRALATAPETETVAPDLSPAQLKAAIDADQLTAEGASVPFEPYGGGLPPDLSPACRVYYEGELDGLEKGRVLIVARTASGNGDPVELSISGIQMNTSYIIVLVTQPGDEESENSAGSAVTVMLADIDPERWYVFIDDAGSIVDVLTDSPPS